MSDLSSQLFEDSGIKRLANARIVIVHAEWNMEIVRELVSGCERVLLNYGVHPQAKIAVPGAFELAFACRRWLESSDKNLPDALIALGCVIRGGTPHFDYICRAVTDGITELNLRFPVPVIFGVLTVDNMSQARDRIGGVHGHKGEEAGLTALKMAALNRALGG